MGKVHGRILGQGLKLVHQSDQNDGSDNLNGQRRLVNDGHFRFDLDFCRHELVDHDEHDDGDNRFDVDDLDEVEPDQRLHAEVSEVERS